MFGLPSSSQKLNLIPDYSQSNASRDYNVLSIYQLGKGCFLAFPYKLLTAEKMWFSCQSDF
ncbi:toxin co-regulated pilus biosynthesis protein H [Vibrio cholerae]|nr:toxin co-regulated pilus biosynthesis protein H [Vibrio cholerae]